MPLSSLARRRGRLQRLHCQALAHGPDPGEARKRGSTHFDAAPCLLPVVDRQDRDSGEFCELRLREPEPAPQLQHGLRRGPELGRLLLFRYRCGRLPVFPPQIPNKALQLRDLTFELGHVAAQAGDGFTGSADRAFAYGFGEGFVEVQFLFLNMCNYR